MPSMRPPVAARALTRRPAGLALQVRCRFVVRARCSAHARLDRIRTPPAPSSGSSRRSRSSGWAIAVWFQLDRRTRSFGGGLIAGRGGRGGARAADRVADPGPAPVRVRHRRAGRRVRVPLPARRRGAVHGRAGKEWAALREGRELASSSAERGGPRAARSDAEIAVPAGWPVRVETPATRDYLSLVRQTLFADPADPALDRPVPSSRPPAQNPARQLTRALARGMQLIVIDPRRTESARRAHVHLQPRPGQDAVLLAAMVQVILAEKWLDEALVADNVAGVEALRAAVEPFTPAYAAMRADVPAESIVRAARVFAQARRGLAVGSTGANMSGRSTLTEYLLLCLNTLCGRYIRAGEPATNPGVLLSRATPRAQPSPPRPAVFPDLKLSVRGLAMSVLGMPTAALADEILAGNIRALFSLGGNPVDCLAANRNHTIAAMERLELFVQMDVRMSASAKLAHYVLPPPLSFETPTMSYCTEFLELINAGWGFSQPFGMSPKVLDHPPRSDLVEEWELFYGWRSVSGSR